MLKFKIITSNKKKVQPALDKLNKALPLNSNGQINSAYTKEKYGFDVSIIYPLENRIYNKVVEMEFKKTLKQIDSKIEIKRIRE